MFFFAPSDSRFQIVVSQPNIVLSTIHQWKDDLFSFQISNGPLWLVLWSRVTYEFVFNTLLSGSDINECLEGDFCFTSGECVTRTGPISVFVRRATGAPLTGRPAKVWHQTWCTAIIKLPFLTKHVEKCYSVTVLFSATLNLDLWPCHQGVVSISPMWNVLSFSDGMILLV